MHGQGTYYYSNGAYYIGSWKNSARNGYGELFYSDGSSFKGYFEDDEKTSNGSYYDSPETIAKKEYFNSLYEQAIDNYNAGYYQTALDYFNEVYDETDDDSLKRKCSQDIYDCERQIRIYKAYETYNEGLRLYNMGDEYLCIQYFEKAIQLIGSDDYNLVKNCEDLIYECR